MLLGIPFHAGLIYGAESWRVNSPDLSLTAETISHISQSFRMPTFFMISGFFAAMMLSKYSPAGWVKGRIIKLGIPLISCMALVNPAMVFFGGLADTNIPIEDRFDVSISKAMNPWSWIGHLWFLAALLWICCAYAALHAVFQVIKCRLCTEVSNRMNALPFPTQLALICVASVAWELIFVFNVELSPIPTYLFFGIFNLRAILTNIPYFLIGVLLFGNVTFRNNFLILSPVSVISGVILIASFVLGIIQDKSISTIVMVTGNILISRMVLAMLYKLDDVHNRQVRRLVDQSFTIYLIHMPVIVILGYLFISVGLPPIIEYIAIVISCIAICLVASEVVSRSKVLAFIFNGRLPK